MGKVLKKLFLQTTWNHTYQKRFSSVCKWKRTPQFCVKWKKRNSKTPVEPWIEMHHRCTTAEVLHCASHNWDLSDTHSLLSRHTGSFFPIFHGFNSSHTNCTWESHASNMPLCWFSAYSHLLKKQYCILGHPRTSVGHPRWMANYFTESISRWVCDSHVEVQPDSEHEPGLDPDFLEKDQQPPCSKEILIVHLPLRVVIYIFLTGLLPSKGPSINLASNTLTAILRNISPGIQSIQSPLFPQPLCLPGSTMDSTFIL